MRRPGGRHTAAVEKGRSPRRRADFFVGVRHGFGEIFDHAGKTDGARPIVERELDARRLATRRKSDERNLLTLVRRYRRATRLENDEGEGFRPEVVRGVAELEVE